MKLFDQALTSAGKAFKRSFGEMGVLTHLSSDKEEIFKGIFSSKTEVTDKSYNATFLVEAPSLEVDLKDFKEEIEMGDLIVFGDIKYEVNDILRDSFGNARLMLTNLGKNEH